MATKISPDLLDADVHALISGGGGSVAFSVLTGDPEDNTNLEASLDAKWTEPANSAVVEAIQVAYTTTMNNKLTGIDTGATDDQTGAEIKSAYEGESDTNAFTDAYKSAIDGLATVASTGAYSDLTGNKPTYKLVNYTATTDPDVNDDTGSGYGVGSYWHNQTDDVAWVCLDVTASNAVWKQIDTVQVSDKDDNGISTGITIWEGTETEFGAITPASNQLSIIIG